MTPLPFEAERYAPISTLWTPHNGMVCYPATEPAQQLGCALARHVLDLWEGPITSLTGDIT